MASGRSRDGKKELFWRRMVRKHAGSGLRVRAWCRRHGQRESAFYWWRAELVRRDAAGREERGAASPAFVPVHITDDAGGGCGAAIEIALGSGRLVRIRGPVDRQTLADVVAVLETSRVEPKERRC